MASREELTIIRAARAGQAAAQLELGRRYLQGSATLPRNLPSALHWLDRAAQQGEGEAWMLIGLHVPPDTMPQPPRAMEWYERAFAEGIAQAGLSLAKLLLARQPVDCAKVQAVLEAAAQSGVAEAQWLLARSAAHSGQDPAGAWEWIAQAAQGGVEEAQYALADHAWAREDHGVFLHWALPLVQRAREQPASARNVELALRCAHILMARADADMQVVVQLLEVAAQGGDRNACLALGLWLARSDVQGRRNPALPGAASYKKALRWLGLAAQQGAIDAMYALSKIYLRPECSQRSPAAAQHYLEMAAHAGHELARFELGEAAWRARHAQEGGDVHAVWWLQQAQGLEQARRLLNAIATPAAPAAWARLALQQLTREARERHPRLLARLEAAALFGLTRNEALLIDLPAADRGHCLVVDIRAQHPHHRRRLIQVRQAQERRLLDGIVQRFEEAGRRNEEEEGNYRQRVYRLKTLAPAGG